MQKKSVANTRCFEGKAVTMGVPHSGPITVKIMGCIYFSFANAAAAATKGASLGTKRAIQRKSVRERSPTSVTKYSRFPVES